MKKYKQIMVGMEIISILDEIRRQLPLRGTVSASYADAILWLIKAAADKGTGSGSSA